MSLIDSIIFNNIPSSICRSRYHQQQSDVVYQFAGYHHDVGGDRERD